MLKKLAMGVAVLCVAVAALTFWATRDVGPSHPVLREAELPPLMPVRDVYADTNYAWDFVASPDARYLAVRRSSVFGRRQVIERRETGEEITELPADILFLRWHPTRDAVRFIHRGDDWEVDLDRPARANWTRISPQKLSGGWAKNKIPTDPDMPILTWGRATTRSVAHMWMVSQDGKTAERVAEGSEDTIYWVFDTQNMPVLRVDALDPATRQVLRMTPEGWVPLITLGVNDTFAPLEAVAEDGTMLTRSSRGRDTVALVRFDTATGDETVVLIEEGADIGLPTSLGHDGRIDVLRLRSDATERIALTPRGEVYLEVLDALPQPVTLGLTVPTASGRYVTQVVSAPGMAPQVLLIDLERGTSEVLFGGGAMAQHSAALVPDEAVRFVARDGLEIPAVLTRPVGVTGPVPFVVHVHGGPALHVALGQRPFVQLLANRGYGVLSVNFRGSTGFGKAFQAKGFREYGRAMQDDITDAANWLVDQGLADPDALAVLGESYGGYAAAMAMTRDPGLFEVGIAEFPMLDVEFQTKHPPGFWRKELETWWRYFGRINTSTDLEAMRRHAPIHRVDDLHGPMMVLAGRKDPIIAVQQVRNFEEKVAAAGKDVTFHYLANAGHGTEHWRDNLRRARLIEDFLAQHLGGRSGGTELAEWAPSFID